MPRAAPSSAPESRRSRPACARAALASCALAACGGDAPASAGFGGALVPTPAAIACAVGDRVRLAVAPAPPRGTRYEYLVLGEVVRVTPDPAHAAATVGCAAVGTTSLTVTDGLRTIAVPVSVTASPGAVLGVVLEPAAFQLTIGAEWRLAARVRVRDSVVSQAVRFATGDTAVAVVDSTGVVRALRAGVATIVGRAAADPSVQGTVAVTVVSAASLVQSIFIDPPVAFVTVGDSVRLRPVINLAPTAPAGTSRDATFTAVDTALVSVTPAGVVRGRRAGVARVVAAPVAAPALRFTVFVSVREPFPP
jgi:large repetitive protein